MQDHLNPDDESFQKFEVFPWNSNFDTGVEAIDTQHKKLISILNNLARSLIINEDFLVNETFEELTDYANYHFSEEEQFWFTYFSEDDSALTSHLLSHASFLPKVIEIKNQKGHSLASIVEEIIKFLIRWLTFHILDNDKRMVVTVNYLDQGKSMEEAKMLADKKMSGSMRVLIETILKMYDKISSSAIDIMRERRERIKAENKLKKAQEQIKLLKGKLPICSYCRRIRNDDNDWENIEVFIPKHSDAFFSHTICPECVKIHHSGLDL